MNELMRSMEMMTPIIQGPMTPIKGTIPQMEEVIAPIIQGLMTPMDQGNTGEIALHNRRHHVTHNRRNQRGSGQAAIEMTVALVSVVILFAGAVKIWAWMVNNMVSRQQRYEATRIDAATDANPGTIDAQDRLTYYTPECLSIFGEDTSKDCK